MLIKISIAAAEQNILSVLTKLKHVTECKVRQPRKLIPILLSLRVDCFAKNLIDGAFLETVYVDGVVASFLVLLFV